MLSTRQVEVYEAVLECYVITADRECSLSRRSSKPDLSRLLRLSASSAPTIHVVDVDKAEWENILKDWDNLGLCMDTEFKHDLGKHLTDFKQ
jgi:hypothetical protein